MIKAYNFSDNSTALPPTKAQRVLRSLGDTDSYSPHFFDDGFPKEILHTDAQAVLNVLDDIASERDELREKLADQTKAADHWMGEACKSHNDLVRANEKLAALLAQEPVAWLYEVNGRIKLETKRIDNYWRGEGDSWVKGKPLILAAGAAPAAKVPEGYSLVPLEPTDEDLAKAVRAMRLFVTKHSLADFRLGYKAMLAAAPKEPTP